MTSRTRTSLVLTALGWALALSGASAQAAFEPPFEVAPPGSNYNTSVARDAAGTTHFAWGNVTGGLLARTRAADGTFGQTLTVSPAGADLELVAGAAGVVHFSWRASDGATDIARTRRLLPDGTLGPTVDLSSAGFNAYEPHVAADSAGGATFAWRRSLGSDWIVQARRRAPDGTLGPVTNISPAGDVSSLQVAANGAGDAALAWMRLVNGVYVAEGRRWAADGGLGEIVQLSDPGTPAQQPHVGVDAGGNAYFSVIQAEALLLRRLGADGVLGPAQDMRAEANDHVWEPHLAVDADGDVQLVWGMLGEIHTRRRNADGSLGSAQVLGDYNGVLDPEEQVAFDSAGNAHHVWLGPDLASGTSRVVLARSVAADGTLGETQQVSAGGTGYAGDADYPALAPGADGRPVAAWMRTDESSLRAVHGSVIAGEAAGSAPAGGGSAGSTGGSGSGSAGSGSAGEAPDLTPPALTRLALRPGRLIAGRRGRVNYTLSEAAVVRLRVARRGAGRRVGGRCVRATRRNRSRKRCDLMLRGSIGASGQAGQNRLVFRGTLRGRRLRTGRYALVAVATDAAGNRSTRVRAGFRITQPAG